MRVNWAAIVLAGPGGNGPFGSIAWVLATSPVFATIQIIEGLTTWQVNATNALLSFLYAMLAHDCRAACAAPTGGS